MDWRASQEEQYGNICSMKYLCPSFSGNKFLRYSKKRMMIW
jgi:hypothetical protein